MSSSSSTTAPTIDTLPPELLGHIFSYLPSSDILHSVLLTSKLFHHVYLTSSELRKKVEVEYAGVRWNPRFDYQAWRAGSVGAGDRLGVVDQAKAATKPALPLPPSSTETLSLLRSRDRAWSSFTYKFKIHIPITHRVSGIYDLTPDVYFLGRAFDAGSDQLGLSGIPLGPFESGGVRYMRLPSEGDKNKAGNGLKSSFVWGEITVPGKTIRDFGTALEEHDLVALVTSCPCEKPTSNLPSSDCPDPNAKNPLYYPHPTHSTFITSTSTSTTRPRYVSLQIHLHHLSTGQPHTQAAHPILPVHIYGIEYGHPSVSIEIVGRYLALAVTYSDTSDDELDGMVIWDWIKGVRKSTWIKTSNTGLTFLTETLILHPNIPEHSFDVYEILPEREKEKGRDKAKAKVKSGGRNRDRRVSSGEGFVPSHMRNEEDVFQPFPSASIPISAMQPTASGSGPSLADATPITAAAVHNSSDRQPPIPIQPDFDFAPIQPSPDVDLDFDSHAFLPFREMGENTGPTRLDKIDDGELASLHGLDDDNDNDNGAFASVVGLDEVVVPEPRVVEPATESDFEEEEGEKVELEPEREGDVEREEGRGGRGERSRPPTPVPPLRTPEDSEAEDEDHDRVVEWSDNWDSESENGDGNDDGNENDEGSNDDDADANVNGHDGVFNLDNSVFTGFTFTTATANTGTGTSRLRRRLHQRRRYGGYWEREGTWRRVFGEVRLVKRLELPVMSGKFALVNLSCRGEPNPWRENSGEEQNRHQNQASDGKMPGPENGAVAGDVDTLATKNAHVRSQQPPLPYASSTRPFTSSPDKALVLVQMYCRPYFESSAQHFDFVVRRGDLVRVVKGEDVIVSEGVGGSVGIGLGETRRKEEDKGKGKGKGTWEESGDWEMSDDGDRGGSRGGKGKERERQEHRDFDDDRNEVKETGEDEGLRAIMPGAWDPEETLMDVDDRSGRGSTLRSFAAMGPFWRPLAPLAASQLFDPDAPPTPVIPPVGITDDTVDPASTSGPQIQAGPTPTPPEATERPRSKSSGSYTIINTRSKFHCSWEEWGGPWLSRWFNADLFAKGYITMTCGERYVRLLKDARWRLTTKRVWGAGGKECNRQNEDQDQGEGQVRENEQNHDDLVLGQESQGAGVEEEDEMESGAGICVADFNAARVGREYVKRMEIAREEQRRRREQKQQKKRSEGPLQGSSHDDVAGGDTINDFDSDDEDEDPEPYLGWIEEENCYKRLVLGDMPSTYYPPPPPGADPMQFRDAYLATTGSLTPPVSVPTAHLPPLPPPLGPQSEEEGVSMGGEGEEENIRWSPGDTAMDILMKLRAREERKAARKREMQLQMQEGGDTSANADIKTNAKISKAKRREKLVPKPIFQDGEVFARPVISRLGYVEIVSKEKFAYDLVLVDEQRLLGFKADLDTGDMVDIEVLYFG
ncbi:hypothetical protein AX16_009837 [Volvariella volvacea WC 439]|nr:hypothetical protein AX16_009837 [Volvariella volvacea WC 439]